MALQKAADVFKARGYQRASIQHLVDEMGINRAGLYAAFGDKHSLFCEVVEQYSADLLGRSRAILGAAGDALDNLYRYLDFLQERALKDPRQGCLINTTAVEVGAGDAPIHQRISGMFQALEESLQETLHRAVHEGDLKSDLPAHALARFFLCFIQGLTVVSKMRMPADYLLDCVAMMRSQIESLEDRD
ncbi:MAG TPA: TetR/AcrR family transcriptional regulator [Acidobacteriota bacterium]|nr:TetR/AcrR family transcriptional regulator [Acidobacteriota bacterium]